ncbi:MAG: sigma-70 family RNA polymerase sigma factor [Actinomycetota bacterium]|nr:sigma-70 family RNA polymerase sigma factor [Actinomycetota bacterium]
MSRESAIQNLVKRAKERDPEAFGELYDEYVDQIFRYIYYKVGNQNDAQDLTGQTFLKAFENIQYYETRDVSFSSWLFRIAHNLAVDFFRSESRRENVPIDEQSPTPAAKGNPMETAMADLDSERLYLALQRLTHNQREVIVLKFIDNLSNAQIAEIMGVSVGAVKSTQKRGLFALNRILSQSSPSSFL